MKQPLITNAIVQYYSIFGLNEDDLRALNENMIGPRDHYGNKYVTNWFFMRNWPVELIDKLA